MTPVAGAGHENQSCTQMNNRTVWKLSCRCRIRVLDIGWAKLSWFRVEQTLLLPSLLPTFFTSFIVLLLVFGRMGSGQGVGESKCRWLWRTWLVLKDWLGYADLRTFYFSCEMYNSLVGIYSVFTDSKSRAPGNTGEWCLKSMRGKHGSYERRRGKNQKSTWWKKCVLSGEKKIKQPHCRNGSS